MPDSDSCLIAKLSHYADLSAVDGELLAALEGSERKFAAGEEIYSGGDEMTHLFVVKSGWLYGYTNLPDGGRHVMRVYHAGDVIGFPSLAFKRWSLNLRSANAGCLCPFEKQDLDVIFENAPRLTALLFTLSSREQVILIDTLRAASRMKPKARLAFFFLDILARLRITNAMMTNCMDMPLTQSDIGDALGLTNVTVSRTLGEMEAEQLIERADNQLILRNEEKLRSLCDFADRHSDMDTSWFPSA